MRTGTESNTVIDLLEKTASMPPNPDFSNWLHKPEPKREFIEMHHLMATEGVTPGMVRFLMQYCYQAGFADGATSE